MNLKNSVLVCFAATVLLAACNSGKPRNEVDKKTTEKDSMALTWIQDNREEKLMPRKLFPDAPDTLIEKLSLQKGIPSSVSTFLLETDSVRILFDTGLGEPAGQMMETLAGKGLSPADISYVYLTHFHGDHIGGLVRGDTAAFPKAILYASKAEYDAWMRMPPLQNAQVRKMAECYEGRMRLFEFGDTLPGNVVAMDAVGHTPGHTVYKAGSLLIIGDVVHGAALQIPYPQYCAEFDMDKAKAVESRKRILQYAKDNRLWVAGMHLPAPQPRTLP